MFYNENGTLSQYYIFDFKGNALYVRNYDKEGNLVKEEGKPLTFMNLDGIFSHQLKGEIFVATPPKCKSVLYSGLVINGRVIDWKTIPIENNVGIYRFKFIKKGIYFWVQKLVFTELDKSRKSGTRTFNDTFPEEIMIIDRSDTTQ